MNLSASEVANWTFPTVKRFVAPVASFDQDSL